MADQVADLFVTLRGINGQFVKSMDEAAVASERTDSKIAGLTKGVGTMALGFGAAVVGIAAESVKMASEFDSTMMRIHTLAGVPKAAIAGLGSQVLQLAGQVGFSPNSLAEALYHVESTFHSTGITGKNAMDILRIAAEGAAVGHADLVGVTNALDAVIASGVGGVSDYAKAMSVLNTIVGAGDMQMQDFVDGAGTGMLAIAKAYGASITDVGAAVATFGDNQIRGQVAATDFRMALMDLTKQGKPGQKALGDIGIKVNQLRDDLQKGGLNAALIDLHDHLDKAGIKGAEIGSFLEDAFTKKSSAPLAILMGQFDRFESKVSDINNRATDFGDSWKSATETISQKWNDFKANLEAGMIGLGHMLTPYVGKIFDVFNAAFQWLESHQDAMKTFGSVVRTFVVGALIAAGVALADLALEFAPVVLGFTAVSLAVGTVAMALVHLYEHNAKFRAFVQGLAADAKKWFGEVVSWFQSNWPKIQQTAQTVIGKIASGVQRAVQDIKGWWADHKQQVESTWHSVENTVVTVAAHLKTDVKQMIDQLKAWWDQHGTEVAQIWNTIFTTIVALIKAYGPVAIAGFDLMAAGIRLAFGTILDSFAVIIDVMTGHWSQAWHDMKRAASDNISNVNDALHAGANFADSFAQAASILAQNLNSIPRNINIQFNATGMPLSAVDQSLGLSGKGHATGGSLDRGWNVVGENGPELVYNENGGRSKVFPAGQSSQMQGARGGGDINLYVTGVAADPHHLAAIVGNEIGWQLRINQ